MGPVRATGWIHRLGTGRSARAHQARITRAWCCSATRPTLPDFADQEFDARSSGRRSRRGFRLPDAAGTRITDAVIAAAAEGDPVEYQRPPEAGAHAQEASRHAPRRREQCSGLLDKGVERAPPTMRIAHRCARRISSRFVDVRLSRLTDVTTGDDSMPGTSEVLRLPVAGSDTTSVSGRHRTGHCRAHDRRTAPTLSLIQKSAANDNSSTTPASSPAYRTASTPCSISRRRESSTASGRRRDTARRFSPS